MDDEKEEMIRRMVLQGISVPVIVKTLDEVCDSCVRKVKSKVSLEKRRKKRHADRAYERGPWKTVIPYVCEGCGARVKLKPCMICDTLKKRGIHDEQ
jgi:rubrerythrin